MAPMASDGYDVDFITLITPSIYLHEGSVAAEHVQEWAEAFGLDSPVLVDRGYMQVVGGSHFGDAGLGYPTVILVAPDRTVFEKAQRVLRLAGERRPHQGPRRRESLSLA